MAHLSENNPAIWTGISLGSGSGIAFETFSLWAQSSSGVTISEDVALQLSTVWACIKVISEDIAALPWHVFQRETEEKRKRRSDHRVEYLLDVEANPDTDAFVFRELMLRWALSFGNGFAEIEKDPVGRVQRLWPIHPENMRVTRDEAGNLVYIVNNEHLFTPDEILHVKGPSPDGVTGWPVLKMAMHTIGLGISAEQYGSEYYANGTKLSGILKTATPLNDEAKKNLRDTWSRLYEGPTNRHRFAILDGDLEWKQFDQVVSNREAEFLESRRFQVDEVCRWFRVAPHKVQSLENATYTNIEHQSIEYVSDTLMPWINRLEREANRKLFQRRDMFSRIMVQAQLRSEAKARGEFYRTLHSMGVMSINEIRTKEEMNPIGPEGEERFMQSGMATVKQIVEGATNTTSGFEEAQEADMEPTEPEEEQEEENDLDVEAQAYAPLLFDFFADAHMKAFKPQFMELKLAVFAKVVYKTHDIEVPESLSKDIEKFVARYFAVGRTLGPEAFVCFLLEQVEYADT